MPEERVRGNHPLRAIRAMADEALQAMSQRFDSMDAKTGRPSIPPGKLLPAQLVQMLYSIRPRKGRGKEAKLSYTGNLLTENRNGLIVDAALFQANGTAERDSGHAGTGGDAGKDHRWSRQRVRYTGLCGECRGVYVTPHVARNVRRRGGSAIDERTARHAGYAVSQLKRQRIEDCFGWLKTVGMMRKVRHRGIQKVGWLFTFAAAAYNLVACVLSRCSH